MARFIRHFLLALQFFTRIPVTGRLAAWVGFSPAMLRASSAHFPGVGWVVGALVASCTVGLQLVLPQTPLTALVAATLGTAVGVLLTGAFHEDGLADVADGLGGSSNRERALEIMKDSRVGAFGALAVGLVLLCKVALVGLLASLQQGVGGAVVVAAGLFAAHVVSRGLPLLTIRLLPHVGDASGSKSKPLADAISAASLGVGGLWCLCALGLAAWLPLYAPGFAALALAWWQCLAAASAASVLTWWWTLRWFARRLQGFTGDCLGATQQLCELAFYIGLALAWGSVLPVMP